MKVLAPVSFVAATEFVYWSGWHDLRIALSLTLIGLPLYIVTWRGLGRARLAAELRRGAWLVGYLAALLLVSFLGSFGSGRDVIAAPWDTVLVAVLGAAAYALAVAAGRAHVAAAATP
jgi:hypothetical protein